MFRRCLYQSIIAGISGAFLLIIDGAKVNKVLSHGLYSSNIFQWVLAMKKLLLDVRLLALIFFMTFASPSKASPLVFDTPIDNSSTYLYVFDSSLNVYSAPISIQINPGFSVADTTHTKQLFYIGNDINDNPIVLDSFVNNALIIGGYYPFIIDEGAVVKSIINHGEMYAAQNLAVISPFINNQGGIINELYNDGSIHSYEAEAIANGFESGDGSRIDKLINLGDIRNDDGGPGIVNYGTITQLDNLQGINGSLVISENLPENYNIVIDANRHFGKLEASPGIQGSMNFGISSLSSGSAAIGHYGLVLWGVSNTRLFGNTDPTKYSFTGTSNRYTYSIYLVNSDDTARVDNTVNTRYTQAMYEPDGNYTILSGVSGGIWSLDITGYTPLISGPTAADTQASLHSLAPKLRGAFSSQTMATNFANMNTYDCNLFDAKGLCVSVGGQQTYVDSPSSNMTSAVVVAGYKVSPTFRIGGFLNQNVNNNTVSNVDISNKTPLMGLFAVWNQNENQLGYQVKIANAYQDKDITTIRDAYGDTGEAGRGKTNLNTQSYVGELSYAFLTNEDKTLVRPYAAVRYTRIKQDGYTESSSVSTPLTYAALADRSTTALLGVKLNHKIAEKVNLTGSIGIEQDLDHHVDNLTATGVAGLTSENFKESIKRTRPVASIGAYYMPVKNQRIAADLYYQQLSFQSTGSATAYVNYTIGF